MVTEAAQVGGLGEDSHGDHRANARQRLQMGEVDIVVKLRLGARLDCRSQYVELLVASLTLSRFRWVITKLHTIKASCRTADSTESAFNAP
ncbi:Uncharacterised protein [Burkholderia pseudomallei]|nr:hypothetical protein AQ857_22695 [Burkholderia pseudomallei]ONC42888.1 hypothetical protein AQ916_29415 [Burkholderia pseudomallei]CAJ2888162.1 Uncharacterised protein [Burkholderia pseudomallei]VBY44816.1 Uncharacterised protein [Burkholderia pseudomallei]